MRILADSIVLITLAAPLAAQVSREIPIDNDSVRVVSVTVPADQKTGMHVHTTNRVMVYLTEGKQSTIREIGPTTVEEWRAGQPLWSPAIGLHRVELSAPGPVSIVEIELKQPPAESSAELGELHPLKVEPDYFSLEFENDQVRVIRVRIPAGASVPMHEHRLPRIVTVLTDADLTGEDESGARTRFTASEGGVVWGDDVVRHSERNQLDTPFEAVVVELK